MRELNDYLYDGNTVLKILHSYAGDLAGDARAEESPVDLAHAEFLQRVAGILEHNDFLTSQSQRIREFYKFMADRYPFLAFTFKGRIKSLVRTEEKYNRYLMGAVEESFTENGCLPPVPTLTAAASDVRDIIAYRIVISLPACHIPKGGDREALEKGYLYEIASYLPDFLKNQGFLPERARLTPGKQSDRLSGPLRPYYKDYVDHPSPLGYQSLHISFYDTLSRTRTEVQLRTKDMDDEAEIGSVDHTSYEKSQEKGKEGGLLPHGLCPSYDDACQRLRDLEELDLTQVKVNMFTARSRVLMNDGCGFFRGRLILPFEHLSRFQNDIVD